MHLFLSSSFTEPAWLGDTVMKHSEMCVDEVTQKDKVMSLSFLH